MSALGAKLSLMDWDTYSQHGDLWSLWIERVSNRLWKLWYQSSRDGNRFLGSADTPAACAALVTPDRFAQFGIEPSPEVFSAIQTYWIRSIRFVS